MPTYIDADGTLLKPIKAWDLGFPLLTIWDSTGTLWWWAAVEDVPTGKGLKQLLDSLNRSTGPLLSERYVRTTSKPFVAARVGHTRIGCTDATIRKTVQLQDDSALAVGPLFGPVISGNGQWLAVLVFYRYSIRIYRLPEGTHIAELRGDTSSSRKCSCYMPDSAHHEKSRYMWAALTQPAWDDTVLITLQVNTFIKSFGPDYTIVGKKYYVLGYYPPNWRISRGAMFEPFTRTFCTGDYCAEGTFYVGGGFVLSKERFYVPFRRGYLAMGSDSNMVKNPYENPLRDTFYTYAPLYGAFSLQTGEFLDSTVGELNEKIGQRYGLGLAFPDPWHMSCDQQTALCAWVQWLSDAIELSEVRRIPLRHYWNPSMLDTTSAKRRSAVPKAREVRYILDSAGAKVVRVLLTPSSVYVLWKVKEHGFALNDREHGFYVLQEYDRTVGTFKGQWQLPARYDGQQFLDIAFDARRNRIAGLYQGAWKTTLVLSLALTPDRLYVGGGFLTAGNTRVNYIAAWLRDTTTSSIAESNADPAWHITSGSLHYRTHVAGPVQCALYDLRGTLVTMLKSPWQEAGDDVIELPSLIPGVYLLHLRVAERSIYRPVIIEP